MKAQTDNNSNAKPRRRVWLKATLITLGSLLGVAIVAVAVVLWMVFTPSQLTRIVNNLASRFVSCETHFERVDLTLFRTFPDAGLRIDNVYVVNPMDGAPSDTVARIGSLTVGVDVKKYLKEREVVVHQLILDDLQAALYTDTAGRSNFDIFPHSDKEKDTTKSAFSLDSLPGMDLDKIKVCNAGATYTNEKSGMDAALADLDICIKGTLTEGNIDATLDLGTDRIALVTKDSLGAKKIDAMLQDMKLAMKAEGSMENVDGWLKLVVKKGQFNDMVNAKLQQSKHDLLTLEAPFHYRDGLTQRVDLDDSRLTVDEYALNIKGGVRLDTLNIDAQVTTDGAWQVAPLLALLPMQVLPDGMDVDGRVTLVANAFTAHPGDQTPMVTATVGLDDGRFHYPAALPYKVNRIKGDVEARLDLSKQTPSTATIKSLSAHTQNTDVSVSGKVDDLLGDMHVDARVKGSLPLADAEPMLPDSLPLQVASGHADLDLKADFRLSQLSNMQLEKIKAAGTIGLRDVDVAYDSLHATAAALDLALQLPARQHAGKLADVHLVGTGAVMVENGAMKVDATAPDINIGVNNPLKEQLAAAFEIKLGETEANIDSMMVSLDALNLDGAMRMDSMQDNPLRKYNPQMAIDMHSAVLYMPLMPDAVRLSQLSGSYAGDKLDLRSVDVKLGHSDFQFYGEVENIERWMSHEGMLVADLNFTSGYTDVDQLLAMVSGMGSDTDTLEQMRQEDGVPDEANPFIVPRDVDITLHTHIRRSVAFGNDLNDVAGSVTVKDGTAILDQIGFVCKAATMQLTALYRSPRPNNLFCALDFHLLDIRIDELLQMIPTVDTLVPMLAAFNGNANFHLAAETYLDAFYRPKMSTLLGSAAISGKDLVVLDNSNIAQIARIMQFKSWKDKDDKIKIDSLDVELTCFRNEIEVYPFVLNIGKYQLCAAGKHTLDNMCNYHIELLKNPLMAKVGVDVKGPLNSPKISLGEVRYADLYRPKKQGVVEKRTLELKRMIREALEANVR